jgi:hypothetical protein
MHLASKLWTPQAAFGWLFALGMDAARLVLLLSCNAGVTFFAQKVPGKTLPPQWRGLLSGYWL